METNRSTLTLAELEASISQSGRWDYFRDLPDAVAWADLLLDSGETAKAVTSHVQEGAGIPRDSHLVPLAKERSGDYRTLLLAHPLDELWYRGLVGKVATRLDLALGEEVRSYRLLTGGPGWSLQDYRYATASKRNEILAFARSPQFGAVGLVDIAQYYPSVTCELLEKQLARIGAPASDVEQLLSWVREWQDVWGVPGIPIGPEGSGLLGNVGLLSLDTMIRTAGVPFLRYTDDVSVLLDDPERWWSLWAAIRRHCRDLALNLNDDKTKLMETPARVRREVEDPVIKRLKALFHDHRPDAVDQCVEVLEELAESSNPSSKRLKYVLRRLAGNGRPEGISILEARPGLANLAPRQWGTYFGVLRDRKMVDGEWLVSQALSIAQPESSVAAVHLLRAASAKALPKGERERLGVLATAVHQVPVPIRCAAAEAWARCQRWKPSHVVEAALEVGDAHQRRALILSLRRATNNRRRTGMLRKLRSTTPGWAITIDWIEAGAPPARRQGIVRPVMS